MARTIVNPEGLHDPTPFGYSHVVSAPAGEVVFVAGQYGSDDQGRVAASDFADQVSIAFGHLRTALDAVDLTPEHVTMIRTFVVDHSEEKLYLLGAAVAQMWGDALPAQTLIGVASLALPGMLFEVDAVAVRS